MGTSRKQRWIPVTLIEMAERIALHIRKEQERGNLMNYPPNLTSAQVLNMALARGLAKMAEEVGMDLSVSNQRNRRQEEEAGEKDRENERARMLRYSVSNPRACTTSSIRGSSPQESGEGRGWCLRKILKSILRSCPWRENSAGGDEP